MFPNIKAPGRKFVFPNIKFGHLLFGQAINETSPHYEPSSAQFHMPASKKMYLVSSVVLRL
ncbi:hypothetical protein [Clostridium saccharoperbutylacetonicum]|uniref:hypothetical protein n=1 Tax=Clostridium saccharoperbutylacetonicum TaxID=36745 RepID=UPI00098578F7|nr:hypothetical protein [Clostridium saccharoperbutylacetonicum]NSB33185.1 hypothetical protein [Clostridium saccharoperbutylacetonicum]